MASNNQGNQGGKSNRGFASMDPQRQREIASEGGRAAHEKGTAHEFTSEEAREAGRKGGMARSANRRSAMQSGGSHASGGNGSGSHGSN
jgi:general stress protein YciG